MPVRSCGRRCRSPRCSGGAGTSDRPGPCDSAFSARPFSSAAGRGDDLEGRAGGQPGLDGAVQQRLGRVPVELLVGVGHRRHGRGRPAGSGRRSAATPSPAPRRCPGRARRPTPARRGRGRRARRTPRSGPSGPSVSSTRPPLGEALLTRSTSRVTNSRGSSPDSTRVVGLLDAGLGVEGEVAGDVRVAQRLVVDALELELVVGLDALGDGVAADHDRPTVAGERGLDDPPVAWVLARARRRGRTAGRSR